MGDTDNIKDPEAAIVDGLLKAGDQAGLNSTERYGKDTHYQATLQRTAKVAAEALGIEKLEDDGRGFPVFRLRGVEVEEPQG